MPLRDTYPLEIALLESLLGCKEDTNHGLNRSALFPDLYLHIVRVGDDDWTIYQQLKGERISGRTFSELIDKLKELGYVAS